VGTPNCRYRQICTVELGDLVAKENTISIPITSHFDFSRFIYIMYMQICSERLKVWNGDTTGEATLSPGSQPSLIMVLGTETM
jgi:hypothetical protein